MNINNNSRLHTSTASPEAPSSNPPPPSILSYDAHGTAFMDYMLAHHNDLVKAAYKANLSCILLPDSKQAILDQTLVKRIIYGTARDGAVNYVALVHCAQTLSASPTDFLASIITMLAEGSIQFNPANMSIAWRWSQVIQEHELLKNVETKLAAMMGRTPINLLAEGRVRTYVEWNHKTSADEDMYRLCRDAIEKDRPWLAQFGMRPLAAAEYTNS